MFLHDHLMACEISMVRTLALEYIKLEGNLPFDEFTQKLQSAPLHLLIYIFIFCKQSIKMYFTW